MNSRSGNSLREDALRIWHAGLDAVRSERLMREAVRVEGETLWLQDEFVDLTEVRRIAVVGAGKAGAGMAAALEEILGPRLAAEKQLTGWVNVPEDCVRTLQHVHLHGARPARSNEPTEAGVRGAEEMLRIVAALGPDDLCLALISGGGSALLPAPVEGVTLADKLAVTRHLSGAGANIAELNTVRKALSRIKGGGLARACRAGRIISLIISDVLGDPLDVIASGPTTPNTTTALDAIAVLERYDAQAAGIDSRVFDALRKKSPPSGPFKTSVTNLVIGNNATAVDAAGIEAERLGYSHAMNASTTLEGPAEHVGRHLAGMILRMRSQVGPDCLITGGEPTVKLVASELRGKGGRNQQLVLAAAELLRDVPEGWAILSGGTDGEDGPTDAAGAMLDAEMLAAARQAGLRPTDFLARNDAYHFFEPLGGLLKTGPTHTNVCDIRVAVCRRAGDARSELKS
jgi:glycerate 2-kinase